MSLWDSAKFMDELNVRIYRDRDIDINDFIAYSAATLFEKFNNLLKGSIKVNGKSLENIQKDMLAALDPASYSILHKSEFNFELYDILFYFPEVNLGLYIKEGHDSINYVSAFNTVEERSFIEGKIKELQNKLVPEATDENVVPIKLYFANHGSPDYSTKNIESPKWDSIKENYTKSTREAFSELLATRDFAGGHLILLHGNPGLGKTFAIQSLMGEWKSWCKSKYIMDPEVMFSETSYLYTLINNVSDENKHNLFVLEDIDELISIDAKEKTGQSLSRLLNTVDGIIGKGLKILFLLTTNEPLEKLHPAVIREGRCIADINFAPLTMQESNEWLKKHDIQDKVSTPMELSKLYEVLRSRPKIIGGKVDKRIGFRESI